MMVGIGGVVVGLALCDRKERTRVSWSLEAEW